MLEIEFFPPRLSLCECCSATTTQLTRYVHEGPDTVAVYLAVFSDGHPFIDMLFGLGVWGEQGSPDKRIAFAARVQLVDNIPTIMLVDRAMAPWDTEFLGRVLDRAEALEHPLKQDVFDLFDFIVSDDAPLNEFLTARSRLS